MTVPDARGAGGSRPPEDGQSGAAGSTLGRPVRLEVVDAVRGLAVLFMIEWHTAEGWLRSPERDGLAFDVAEIVGGFAAPFFFLLLGLGLGLGERLPATTKGLGAAVRRGLGILVAGYALRTWAWAVDRSALIDPAKLPFVLAFAAGLGCAWVALGDRMKDGRARVALGALGVVVALATALVLPAEDASTALRLDVLHGLGVALVLVALVLFASSRVGASGRVAVTATLALAVALIAPHVISVPPPPGPIRIWDYVARFDVTPASSGARFPIVPWLGYSFVGATPGRALRGRTAVGGPLGLPIAIPPAVVLCVFATLAVVAFEAGPLARPFLERVWWLRNVDRLVFYTSVAIACAALVATLARGGGLGIGVLGLLGRHSLVIYAVHLEIAYGLPGSVISRSLGWGTWAALALLLLLSMIVLALAIERLEARRPRDHERSATART